VFIYRNLADTPKSIGLPTIEDFTKEYEVEETSSEEVEKESFKEVLFKSLLPNKILWTLALTYIFVYIIRYGTSGWLFVFFNEFKDYNKIESAGFISLLNLVGIFGSVASGFISDKFFKGKRMPLNLISLLILALAMWLLLKTPNNSYFLDSFLVAIIGIFTYIPHVLVGGVCAVEVTSKKLASAATGFTGLFGYVGTSIAGPATGWLLDHYTWSTAIWFWVVSALLAALICIIPLVSESKRFKITATLANK
jgi:sugar phosphate permease